MKTVASSLDLFVSSSGDQAYDHIRASLIRNALRKMFSPGAFFLGEVSFPDTPIVKLFPFSETGGSIILVCSFHGGVEKFFYEMVTRWLLPEKKISPISVFFTRFCFAVNPEEERAFCEIRFLLQNADEKDLVIRNFAQIASEITIGALSPYQGNRILDLKGQFSSEKNTIIHERIAALIHRRPKDFDYDVFGQMQHFFVHCKEEFKQARESYHLSRMIYVFYLFRKSLKESIERAPEKRHLSLKINQVRIYSPFGVKKVLGVFLGLNLLKAHEMMEERHLMKAIKDYLPEGKIVEGSQFIYQQKEEKIHILYVEIEKEGEGEFSASEMKILRLYLPLTLENRIEKLMPTIFMPRNEEEVMKNIVILAKQLRYTRDLPQVFISFEEQGDAELTFTVIFLRILSEEKVSSLQTLFKQGSCRFAFLEDRVKKVGTLRRKYEKEATVFRLKGPKSLYIRGDHSLDLLRARQDVVEEIRKVVGEFRDYNGGMIANQVENFYRFKQLFSPSKSDLELEMFFHSIAPVEMRSVLEPSLLKIFYDLWEETSIKKERGKIVVHIEKETLFIWSCFLEEKSLSSLNHFIKNLGLSASQTLFSSLCKNGDLYAGYLVLGLPQQARDLCLIELKEWEQLNV